MPGVLMATWSLLIETKFGTTPTGVTSLIAETEGKVLDPKTWNATDTPSIFGLAVDQAGRVLAAVWRPCFRC